MEHESYVSLETAKLLKQAGFDWGCYSFYGLDVRYKGKSIDEDEEYELKARGRKSEIEYVQGGRVYSGFYHSNKKGEDYGGYSRPTLAIAQKWLREVKGWDIDVTTNREHIGVFYECTCIDKNVKVFNQQSGKEITPFLFDTYEEAQEAGIKKCLDEDCITDKCSEE